MIITRKEDGRIRIARADRDQWREILFYAEPGMTEQEWLESDLQPELALLDDRDRLVDDARD